LKVPPLQASVTVQDMKDPAPPASGAAET
jgi:hypothetical protein